MPSPSLIELLLPGVREINATALVDAMIAETVRRKASDLHLLPNADGLSVQWRVDGVLGKKECLPASIASNVVTRFKVLANLLTYESQTPQEGQIGASPDYPAPMRVSTFPTLFGEKVVVRLLTAEGGQLARLAGLQLPKMVEEKLAASIRETSGVIVLVGPAGSGKTTTAYAAMRHIHEQSNGQRSLTSLEDPIEVVLPGVAQAQVAPHAGFDLRSGLRALVRQDPEVILVGEIRDAETAEIAFQAALTGQLVITTFHAADAATAIVRLLDMGIPDYMLRGATRAILAQRLVRQLCPCQESRTQTSDNACPVCHSSGYHGRRVIAEVVDLSDEGTRSAIRSGVERQALLATFAQRGVVRMREQAEQLVLDRTTDRDEIDRVMGVEQEHAASCDPTLNDRRGARS